MPPTVALALWFILLVALFRFDPAKEKGVSTALWLPLIWMAIRGSRLPSQWLGLRETSAFEAYQEGNSFDRTILSLLILMAVGVLLSRSFKLGDFLSRNLALMLFIAYTLLSVVWSDFPLISLKRWSRDLGHYLMVFVVLSDPRPVPALRTLLRRLAYLLIPVSIVLIKYFPQIGKGYSYWTGEPFFQGVGIYKNSLGTLCLISGLVFFWDTLTRWSGPKRSGSKRIILLNFAFLAMTLWLLHLSRSATSALCLAVGCVVIALVHTGFVRRHPAILKTLIPVALCLYLILELSFGVNDTISRAVGRDPTLTGRTELWESILAMKTNWLLGTGYESFWLGSRLEKLWQLHSFRPNQAHNGYLEVYLNLGILGWCFLGGFLLASYRRICRRLMSAPNLASLSLAIWTIMFFYNVTEAAFKTHLMWFTFLLVAISVPREVSEEMETLDVSDGRENYTSHEPAVPPKCRES